MLSFRHLGLICTSCHLLGILVYMSAKYVRSSLLGSKLRRLLNHEVGHFIKCTRLHPLLLPFTVGSTQTWTTLYFPTQSHLSFTKGGRLEQVGCSKLQDSNCKHCRSNEVTLWSPLKAGSWLAWGCHRVNMWQNTCCSYSSQSYFSFNVFVGSSSHQVLRNSRISWVTCAMKSMELQAN